MNHRKIRSQGYIPFSWEEKPGIPKTSHQKSSSDMSLTDLKMLSENLSSSANAHITSIVPPPPCTLQPPRKSFRMQDDPFIAALRSCTKGVSTRRGYEELGQKNEVSCKEKGFSKRGVFSCKQACNVEDDNLVKFTKLPPIPKERYSAKSFVWN